MNQSSQKALWTKWRVNKL